MPLFTAILKLKTSRVNFRSNFTKNSKPELVNYFSYNNSNCTQCLNQAGYSLLLCKKCPYGSEGPSYNEKMSLKRLSLKNGSVGLSLKCV